jgi:hypothetical protein
MWCSLSRIDSNKHGGLTMRFTFQTTCLLLCVAALEGCISTHSFVDPQYRHATFSDLARPAPPYTLSVKVEFQRNGEAKPAVDREIRTDIERTLRASGVAVPYDGTGTADGEISFVLNNVTNLPGAVTKGFGTGVTFGLVGSHVTDNYEMTVRLTQGEIITKRIYQHAILSTVGNASAPPGMTPVNLATAVSQVIDDLVLNSLKDFQAGGLLVPKTKAVGARL